MSSQNIRILITPTYFPNSLKQFTLSEMKEDPRNKGRFGNLSKYNDSDDILKAGITDGWTKNQMYREVLQLTKIGDLESKVIIEEYGRLITDKQMLLASSSRSKFRYEKALSHIDKELKRNIIKRHKAGWSISKICAMYFITPIEFRLCLAEDKTEKRLIMKQEDQAKLPMKITQRHIKLTEELLKKIFSKKITLKKVNLFLREAKDLRPLSKSGVHYLMRNILKYTYERAYQLPK